MSIFYTILYISHFSGFRAYEVGVTRKGLPENVFSKASPFIVTTALLSENRADYIMPPIPPAGICGKGFSAGFSASTHSVVRNIDTASVRQLWLFAHLGGEVGRFLCPL